MSQCYNWSEFDVDLLRQVDKDSRECLLASGFCKRITKGPGSPDMLQLLPHTMLPSQIPAAEFALAVQVQPIVNAVYHRVAHNSSLLQTALVDTCAVDPFTKRLFDLHEQSLREGRARQFSLGLLRSDYMMNDGPPDDLPNWSAHLQDANSSPNPGGHVNASTLRQVEVNTIASSLGGITPLLAQQHRRNLNAFGYSNRVLNEKQWKLPVAHSIESLSTGMINAWKKFGDPNAAILFLVDDPCTNLIDQKKLEQQMERMEPDLLILRRSFVQLRDCISIDEQRRLLVSRPQTGSVRTTSMVEIALVYMRSGYSPDQYGEQDWNVRAMMERSRAILCPSASYQLAGTKKMQQVLCQTDILSQFVDNPNEMRLLRSTFAHIWPLSHNQQGNQAFELASKYPKAFVLKPQREGGGNNIFDQDIVKRLKPLEKNAERDAFVLMERIWPKSQQQILIKANCSLGSPEPIISELGIFGAVFGDEQNILFNQEAGFVLRSKPPSYNEGGIAAGYGVLDTPLLIG